MTETILWVVFLALALGVVIMLRSRSKGTEPAKSKREWKGDLILDRNRKRLYDAMKSYLVEERKEDLQWQIFEFIDALPTEITRNRTEVEKQVATRFRLGEVEAAAMLAKVVTAIHTVKQRSKSTSESGKG